MIYDNIHNLSHFKTGRRGGLYVLLIYGNYLQKKLIDYYNYNWRGKVKNNYYCVLDYVMLYGGIQEELTYSVHILRTKADMYGYNHRIILRMGWLHHVSVDCVLYFWF